MANHNGNHIVGEIVIVVAGNWNEDIIFNNLDSD
jgi:hypothetical protein